MTTTVRTTICKPAEVAAYLGLAPGGTDIQMALIEMLMPMCDATINTFLGYNVVQRNYVHIVPDVDMFIVNQNDIGLPVDVVNNQITYTFPGPPVILQLPELPVRSISTFAMDYSALGGQGPTDFAAATDITQGTQYYIDYDCPDPGQTVPYKSGISWTGHVRAWIGVFSGRQRTIQVSYTAGFSPDELDGRVLLGYRNCMEIKYASILTCAAAYLEAKATQVNGLGAQGPITMESIGDAKFAYDKESVAQMQGMMQVMPWKATQILRQHQRSKR